MKKNNASAKFAKIMGSYGMILILLLLIVCSCSTHKSL